MKLPFTGKALATMKLLLSAAAAAAISMLFCLFSPPFMSSLSVYFSSTVHKNYMFLLCNGILLLLVQSSGLVSNFPVDSDCREATTANNGNREKTTPPSLETLKEEIKAVVRIEDVEETENAPWSSPIVEEIEVLIEQDGEETGLILFEEEEEEEEEEEGEEHAYVGRMMSREELNKKCDDFISKMKEAIHSEMHRLVL